MTLAGTGNAGLLLESETLAGAPLGALVRVSVQLAEPGAAKVAGEQLKPANSGAADRVTVEDRVWPLYVADTVADWSVVTLPAFALNEPDVAPKATDTDAGIARFGLSRLNEIDVALVAGFVSVTVQVATVLAVRVVGEQERLDNCGGADTDINEL